MWVAITFAGILTFRELLFNLSGTLTDRVGRLGLNLRLHRLINDIPGIEHLERSEYLDKVVIVRGGAGALLRGTWGAVATAFAVLKIVVSLFLLAAVSWWMPSILLFALLPILANRKGQTWVAVAEETSMEDYRLQQSLFDLQIKEAGRKELRLFGSLASVRARQDKLWADVVRIRFAARIRAGLMKFFGWIVFAAAFAGAIELLVLQVQNGQGTVGDLVLAATVALSLQQGAQTVIANAAEAASSLRVLKPYLWLSQYARDHGDHGATTVASQRSAQLPERLSTGVVFDKVGFTYPGADHPALEDVTLNFAAGTFTAVVGDHGSGKSTLIKLLAGLYTAQEGVIMLEGRALMDYPLDVLRSRSVATFQDFARYEVKLGTAVGIGDLPQLDSSEAVARAIEQGMARDVVNALPARRAHCCALDARNEDAIFNHLVERSNRLSREAGTITVIVSHRFSTVVHADQIVVLARGRVVEVGNHEQLMALNGYYQRMFSLQAAGYVDQ